MAEHQRFASLVEEVTVVSEAICAARPPAAGTAPCGRRGRGLAAQLEEVAAAEVGKLASLAAGLLGQHGAGLGVLEQAMRAALDLSRRPPAGSRASRRGRVLRSRASVRLRRTGRLRRPPFQDRHDRARLVTLRRAWNHCAECRHGFAPATSSSGRPAARCRRVWPR